jgi:hypothetical protein
MSAFHLWEWFSRGPNGVLVWSCCLERCMSPPHMTEALQQTVRAAAIDGDIQSVT